MIYKELRDKLKKIEMIHGKTLETYYEEFEDMIIRYNLWEVYAGKNRGNIDVNSEVMKNYKSFTKELKEVLVDIRKYSINNPDMKPLYTLMDFHEEVKEYMESPLGKVTNSFLDELKVSYNKETMYAIHTTLARLENDSPISELIKSEQGEDLEWHHIMIFMELLTTVLAHYMPEHNYIVYRNNTTTKYSDLHYYGIPNIWMLIGRLGAIELFYILDFKSIDGNNWPYNKNQSIIQFIYERIIKFNYTTLKHRKLLLMNHDEYSGISTKNLVYLLILEDILAQASSNIGCKEIPATLGVEE